MFHFSRRVKIIFVFAVLVAGGYAAAHFWNSSWNVPQEFKDSRLQGALIAQNIVNLSNQSALDLDKINELDRQKNFTEALNLTTDVINRSVEIRNQAVELSAEIAKMTSAISGIRDLSARQAALEAITSRLALINKLINYSDYLSQLLETLRSRFAGTDLQNRDVVILINQINAEVRAVNSFNGQAGQAMDRFDRIVNRK